jgi:hypothetical protein
MTTFMSLAALVVALVALGYAWKLNRELDSARERLDRYNRSLFKVEESIRTLRAEMEDAKTRLHVEIVRRSGDVQFSPQMTVREATLLHPQVQQILAGFHLGGCSSCAVEPDETLAEICVSRGVNESELLTNLNQLLGGGTNGAHQPLLVKVPNVHLDLEL